MGSFILINILVLFSDGDSHLGTMSIIINADVLDIGKIVKVNKE